MSRTDWCPYDGSSSESSECSPAYNVTCSGAEFSRLQESGAVVDESTDTETEADTESETETETDTESDSDTESDTESSSSESDAG